MIEHCRDILRMDKKKIFCGWIAGIFGGLLLQRYSVIGLQGYFAVEHCRDTLRLGTAGILCGWALQGYFATIPIR